ncbi:multiple epidermal growth factor-like domains protein 9 [Denticeps clupeoides]|uniref:Laminin EGF-like domain-containing protein n=1 Tax=Denticeps clupeoides TaxID=299321 RepID=A0AAY4DIL6_9TELE|nr:multiple epidermal growth factor-like domains protein 9 [Denticeps clupeoides]
MRRLPCMMFASPALQLILFIAPRVISTDVPFPGPTDSFQELPCNCSGEGVQDPEDCDPATGQCSCLPGYAGLQCEECEEAHFTNGTSGCLPCGCDSFGAEHQFCDSSGACACKTGVYGPKCDECHPGFFRFSSTGCQPCQCNNHTSSCHPQSGGCLDCQGNTHGPKCEECLPNSYRRPGEGSTESCAPCPCSDLTSSGSCHVDPRGNAACDECKAGFSGATCARCADGFHRSGGACAPCECHGNADPRSAPRLCHPDSGRCLSCANHTAGQHCELCAPGYTGDARTHNCTLRARPVPSTTAEARTSPAGPPTSSTIRNSTGAGSTPATRALLTSLGSPTRNSTAAALSVVSWTQFNVILLAVIIAVVVLLMGFVGAVYTYREYRNRKLNAPFWTIELKEDNISFSSYHDSIPNADPSGLLEEEQCPVATNGQLALSASANMYKV